MALRLSSSSSLCSFTSYQLCDIEDIEEEEDFEYHTAPWDIFGVHDKDGQILAVKKGESLPVTTKYKRTRISGLYGPLKVLAPAESLLASLTSSSSPSPPTSSR